MFFIVERLSVLHVIERIDPSLCVDHQAGIANAREQIFRHRALRLKQIRENLLVGFYYRIIGLEYIKPNASIISVHHCLDRVAEIVGATVAYLISSRVRILVSVSKSIDRPVKLAVAPDYHIWVILEEKKRGDLANPFANVPPNQNAALGVYVI